MYTLSFVRPGAPALPVDRESARAWEAIWRVEEPFAVRTDAIERARAAFLEDARAIHVFGPGGVEFMIDRNGNGKVVERERVSATPILVCEECGSTALSASGTKCLSCGTYDMIRLSESRMETREL